MFLQKLYFLVQGLACIWGHNFPFRGIFLSVPCTHCEHGACGRGRALLFGIVIGSMTFFTFS